MQLPHERPTTPQITRSASQSISATTGPSTRNNVTAPLHIVQRKWTALLNPFFGGIFERAKRVDEKEFLKAQVQISNKEYQQKLKLAKAEYSKATKELSKWEELMLASIEGTCVFTPGQVKKRMDIAQEKVDGLSKEIEMLQIGMSEAKTISSEILAQHQQLLSWAELFDSASIDEKKVISSQMIKAVTLTRNYGIQIEFKHFRGPIPQRHGDGLI